MRVGYRAMFFGDSTSYVECDFGDTPTDPADAFLAKLWFNDGVTVVHHGIPASKVTSQIANNKYNIGLTSNIKYTVAINGATGMDFDIFCIGHNDWANPHPTSKKNGYRRGLIKCLEFRYSIGMRKAVVLSPFRFYHEGDEPTNTFGETLQDYRDEAAAAVLDVQGRYPAYDIVYADTLSWIPDSQTHFTADGTHVRDTGHLYVYNELQALLLEAEFIG